MNVKIIGIGGIGGCLLPVLCRFLSFGPIGNGNGDVDVTLVDGDRFENRNRDRQSFTVFGNKAEATAASLRSEFPRIRFRAIPEYVVESTVDSVIREGDIVFACVDNHRTRGVISGRCEELDDVTLISAGNDFTDGNVQVHKRRGGRDLTLPIVNRYHEELVDANDFSPEAAACGEMAQSGDPQLVITNNLAAAIMLCCFYGVLSGTDTPSEAYFDVKEISCRPVFRAACGDEVISEGSYE